MERLLVFSDIHGSFSGWLTVKALADPGDAIAIAGDLFDTRYGSYDQADFSPEQIRSSLPQLGHELFYVYGNCDVEGFCKGFLHELAFKAFNKTIFMHHGHKSPSIPDQADIVIQGHTHLPQLEKTGAHIVLNPGSIVLPRNQMATYGIIDKNGIHLVALNSGKELASISF